MVNDVPAAAVYTPPVMLIELIGPGIGALVPPVAKAIILVALVIVFTDTTLPTPKSPVCHELVLTVIIDPVVNEETVPDEIL